MPILSLKNLNITQNTPSEIQNPQKKKIPKFSRSKPKNRKQNPNLRHNRSKLPFLFPKISKILEPLIEIDLNLPSFVTKPQFRNKKKNAHYSQQKQEWKHSEIANEDPKKIEENQEKKEGNKSKLILHCQIVREKSTKYESIIADSKTSESQINAYSRLASVRKFVL